MPLIDLWEKARETVVSMSALQILVNAGNGCLKDNSRASSEIREFLTYVSIDELERYISECLSEKLNEGGFFLQDIVNELGRRLENIVEHGRYRGVQGKIGFDGLWRSPEGHCILVEVKSSTNYPIDLDKIASYRNSLEQDEQIGKNSSVLIAVGSEDTRGLEAQIRGSRYAWDMRVISLEGLVKLVRIKEATEEESTARKIRGLLIPIEYTKLDGIIDVMFATTTDIEETMNAQSINVYEAEIDRDAHESAVYKVNRTGHEQLKCIKQAIVEAVEGFVGVSLQAKSKALYLTKSGNIRIFCAVSKKYNSTYAEYWYAYRRSHQIFLKDAEKAYVALGCTDSFRVFLIPVQVIENILPVLNYTESKTGNRYWHLCIGNEEGVGYVIATQRGCENLSLENYTVSTK